MISHVHRLMRRFTFDVRGIAVTEFAIIAPLILTLLLLSVSGFDSYRGLRRASTTVDIVGDLASRQLAIGATQRDDIFAAAEALLDNYAVGNNPGVILSSVEQDADGNYVVLWSVANAHATSHGATLPADVEADLPAIPTGESIIVTELDFQFQPSFADIGIANITVDQLSISRPRMVAQIAYNP